jgi:hypothetical protein
VVETYRVVVGLTDPGALGPAESTVVVESYAAGSPSLLPTLSVAADRNRQMPSEVTVQSRDPEAESRLATVVVPQLISPVPGVVPDDAKTVTEATPVKPSVADHGTATIRLALVAALAALELGAAESMRNDWDVPVPSISGTSHDAPGQEFEFGLAAPVPVLIGSAP